MRDVQRKNNEIERAKKVAEDIIKNMKKKDNAPKVIEKEKETLVNVDVLSSDGRNVTVKSLHSNYDDVASEQATTVRNSVVIDD